MRETHRIVVADGQAIVVDWTPPAPGGSGRTAVFVHGLGSHRRGEKATSFGERFAGRGWGYLAVDLRGHGESEGAMRDLTLSRCLADLRAALDWLPAGRERPVLIGSSMGAAVVAWHQVAQPRTAGPVVLIAPALTFPGRYFWQLGPADLEAWRNEGVRRFTSEWIDLEIGFSLVEDAAQYEPQRLLQAYAAPTLIFHGMRDTSVSWRGTLTFVEDCPNPNLRLVLIKEGDHRLTDHKAFLFETIWAWLEEQG